MNRSTTLDRIGRPEMGLYSAGVLGAATLVFGRMTAVFHCVGTKALSSDMLMRVPRQLVYGHFVYDTSSPDISSTDISSTTVYQRVTQLYIQLLFHQIIIFINSNFYLHYDSFLSIPLPLTLLIIQHIQLASIVA